MPRNICRTFFTKKLERRFEEKDLEVPHQLLFLMDVPFADFGPEHAELYETGIRPLARVFLEHLTEIYEMMGRPKRGWEEMLERVDPSPIKVLASLVIQEDETEQHSTLRIGPDGTAPAVSAPAEKMSVRAYRDRDADKERWWERKIF